MAITDIEWAMRVWNVIRGCALTTPGCTACYAMGQAHRFSGKGMPYEGLTKVRDGGGVVWNGKIRTVPEKLSEPLRVKKPATWFVNSMSDLWQKGRVSIDETFPAGDPRRRVVSEGVPWDFIAAVFGVMAFAPQHTFQVLTKGADEMADWFDWIQKVAPDGNDVPYCVEAAGEVLDEQHEKNPMGSRVLIGSQWPLPNVHVGVSVENRKHGLPRLDALRRVPAVVRWASIEPLLEDLGEINLDGIAWVVVGAESGHGARPMNEDWVRNIRDQCVAKGVRFFYKQHLDEKRHKVSLPVLDGRQWRELPDARR